MHALARLRDQLRLHPDKDALGLERQGCKDLQNVTLFADGTAAAQFNSRRTMLTADQAEALAMTDEHLAGRLLLKLGDYVRDGHLAAIDLHADDDKTVTITLHQPDGTAYDCTEEDLLSAIYTASARAAAIAGKPGNH